MRAQWTKRALSVVIHQHLNGRTRVSSHLSRLYQQRSPTYSMRVHQTTSTTMTNHLTLIKRDITSVRTITSGCWHNTQKCTLPVSEARSRDSSVDMYEANFSAYRNEILCVGANKYLYFLFSIPRGENTNSLCGDFALCDIILLQYISRILSFIIHWEY